MTIDDIRDIRLKRDGLNLIISNVPEGWHGKLKIGKNALLLIELILATGALVSVLFGFVLGLPIISSVLSILLLIEVGRERTEFEHKFSVTTPSKTYDPRGTVWDYGESGIISYDFEYLDNEGNTIDPDNKRDIIDSDCAKLIVTDTVASMFSEGGEFEIELPYGVRKLKIEEIDGDELRDETVDDENEDNDKNWKEKISGGDLSEEEAGEILSEITEEGNKEDISEALNDQEGMVEFVLPSEVLLTEGRLQHVSSENDRRSITLRNDGKNVICTTEVNGVSNSGKLPIRDLEPAGVYVVTVRWSPEGDDLWIIPKDDLPHHNPTGEATGER